MLTALWCFDYVVVLCAVLLTALWFCLHVMMMMNILCRILYQYSTSGVCTNYFLLIWSLLFDYLISCFAFLYGMTHAHPDLTGKIIIIHAKGKMKLYTGPMGGRGLARIGNETLKSFTWTAIFNITYIHTYIHTHIQTSYTHTNIPHKCRSSYIHILTSLLSFIHTYIHTYIHTCIHT